MSTDANDQPDEEETYSLIRTVLGSTRRADRWHLTDEVQILTALGRSRFDLRGAEATASPVVEVSVVCVLGTVSLLVPHGTLVVLDGTSFLASASSRVSPGTGSHLPRIDVTATTVLGRVRIVSLDDETAELVTADPVATADAAAAPAPSPAPAETSATVGPRPRPAVAADPAVVDAAPAQTPDANREITQAS